MSTPRTYESFKQDEPRFERRTERAHELVNERIRACVEDPEKHRDDPLTYVYARLYCESQAQHQCYWNDRFVAAVMCGMSLDELRVAAWCVVSNGANCYFEWHTHGQHDMRKVFAYLGIDTQLAYARVTDLRSYYTLDPDILRQLIKMFDLPTLYMGVKSRLTDQEYSLRERFNGIYPHTKYL